MHTQKIEGKFSLHYSFPFPRNSLLFFSALPWLHFKGSGEWNKTRSKINITSHRFTSKDSITEKSTRREVMFLSTVNSVHVTFLYLNLQSFVLKKKKKAGGEQNPERNKTVQQTEQS